VLVCRYYRQVLGILPTTFRGNVAWACAGKQAEVLNILLEDVVQGHPVSEQRLKEVLGHTPLQVILCLTPLLSGTSEGSAHGGLHTTSASQHSAQFRDPCQCWL
jgi:hypothetical protein